MASDATLAEQKAQLREACLARRATAGPLSRAAAGVRLWSRLRHLRGATIAGYLPIGSEADPRATMRVLSRDNTICVPIVTARGAPLRFRQWWPGCPTAPGAFGVQEPVEGGWRVPQILIVPMVGFDARCCRLGYGGGFYDRTLAGLGQAEVIGFALEAQRVDAVPVEETDIALGMIVTEKGVFAPGLPGGDAAV